MKAEKQQELKVIARLHSDFPTKFGIPRQSGLINALTARVVFEPKYRSPEAFRGLEGYSHIWLLWGFSAAPYREWSPTVRPPRLGGNQRVGVFASRSPYRPNSIAISSLKLEKIELNTPDGPVLTVSGADILDGSPIYDVKPYLPFTDCHPEAKGGFADWRLDDDLKVELPPELAASLPEDKKAALLGILAHDPRPAYQHDSERVYGLEFAGYEVKFRVEEPLLIVLDIQKAAK